MLSRPALYWVLAAVFAVRAAFFAAFPTERPDAQAFILSGKTLLARPDQLYDYTARAIAELHSFPVPGTPNILGPPPAAFLAAPFALLPLALATAVWTLFDAVALVAGLFLIYKLLRPTGIARPVFWLAAAYFPPLFADVDAGQRGGVLLLLAALSMRLESARPVLAGAFAGLAASIKIYPAAMVIGPSPRRRLLYAAGLAVTAGAVLALSFIPLGASGITTYVTGVLLPVLSVETPDCGVASVHGLYMRTLGGQAYALPGANGIVFVRTPVDLPQLATPLIYVTIFLVIGSAVWAAWRSGWQPLYGLSLGFALGALVPNEVYPYQMLPLLPLVLAVLVRALQARRYRVVALLALGLLGFVRQPCFLPFPNVWTVAALFLWAICVWNNELFRDSAPQAGGVAHGDQ